MRLTRRRALGLVAAGGMIAATAAAAKRREHRMEASYPPLGDRIDLGADFAGQKIHVFQAGPRTAPPVVLIHGASGNLRDFTFGFIDRISDRFRVIAIDRPGFGYSDRGDGNAHLPDNQAAAMRAAAEALGVNRAIIAGHSLGSASALSWALDAPETVAGVLVLGGVSHPWKGTAGHVYDVGSVPGVGHMLAGAVAAFVSERRAKSGIEAIFRPQAAPDGYADYVGVALALRAATFRYNNLDIGLLKPYLKRRSPEYANLATPIEIVHGALDTIVPPDVHSIPLSQKAPNARLNLLEGVGHMPHHVAPEACEAALDRLSASF